MIALLLGISLMNATDNSEIMKRQFLDEFYDYEISQTESLDYGADTLYIELDEVEFLPSDIESTCDFTTERKPCPIDIHT